MPKEDRIGSACWFRPPGVNDWVGGYLRAWSHKAFPFREPYSDVMSTETIPVAIVEYSVLMTLEIVTLENISFAIRDPNTLN